MEAHKNDAETAKKEVLKMAEDEIEDGFLLDTEPENEADKTTVKSTPKKKKRIRTRATVTLTKEKKAEIEEYVRKNHIPSVGNFIQTAIDFYLTAQRGTDRSESVIIGKDAAAEINRALEPVNEENQRRDRTTKILLNAIWHTLQASSNMTDAETEALLVRAVREIDSTGKSFSANDILAGAKAEHAQRQTVSKTYSTADPVRDAENKFFNSPERRPNENYNRPAENYQRPADNSSQRQQTQTTDPDEEDPFFRFGN